MKAVGCRNCAAHDFGIEKKGNVESWMLLAPCQSNYTARMTNHSPSLRASLSIGSTPRRLLCGALALAGTLAAPMVRAEVSRISFVYNEAIRGGVVVDGIAVKSAPTVSKSAKIKIQLPLGAKVERAWLVSSVGALNSDLTIRPTLVPVPGTPRQVVLGPGTKTIVLEGKAPLNYKDELTIGTVGYGAWVTEVTPEMKTLIPAGTDLPIDIDISERGDGDTAYQPVIYGHSLAVVYSLATAPLRNVVVGAGLMGGPSECTNTANEVVALKKPTTLLCKESFPISVTVMDNAENCDVGNPMCSFSANATVLSTRVGGLDDLIETPSTALRGGSTHYFSTGSFGASGALAVPLGLTKTFGDGVVLSDNIKTVPSQERFDDELYDLSVAVAEGDSSVTLKYASNACDALSMIAFQTAVDCGPTCAADSECKATELCHDPKPANLCISKVANGNLMPAGGTIDGKCTPAQAKRACVSQVCETVDNKCGLLIGSTCTKSSECRTGECGTASRKCEVSPGVPDAGSDGGGSVDGGRDSGVTDSGITDSGVVPPSGGGGDAATPTEGALSGGSVEGGGTSCAAAPSGTATVVPVLLGLGLVVGALRRRRN
jgi:hypothetical protein